MEKIVASTALEIHVYEFVFFWAVYLGEMNYHSSQLTLKLLCTNSFIFFYLDMNKPSIKMAFWSKSGDYIVELFTFVSRKIFPYLVPAYIIGLIYTNSKL